MVTVSPGLGLRCIFYFLGILIVVISISGDNSHCPPAPWRPFQNTCFLLSDIMRPFDEARMDCFARGGMLASIRNREELKFLAQTIVAMQSSFRKIPWIIGLYQFDPEDRISYRWVDGSVAGFKFWSSNQPNNIYERCVHMLGGSGFRWSDAMCQQPAYYICRKDQYNFGCYKGSVPIKRQIRDANMTVTACIERCRGTGFPYAGVRPWRCVCIKKGEMSELLTVRREICRGACLEQHCGTDSNIAVYNVSQYPERAKSCRKLWQSGVRRPSIYELSDGKGNNWKTMCFDASKLTQTENKMSVENIMFYLEGSFKRVQLFRKPVCEHTTSRFASFKIEDVATYKKEFRITEISSPFSQATSEFNPFNWFRVSGIINK